MRSHIHAAAAVAEAAHARLLGALVCASAAAVGVGDRLKVEGGGEVLTIIYRLASFSDVAGSSSVL